MRWRSVLAVLNRLPVWRRTVRVGRKRFSAISFDRLLNLYLHRLGLMGREEMSFLRSVVKPGMAVVDVGANQGLYTLLLSDLVGESGSVVAFEPDRELFEILLRNCAANHARNVRAYDIAIGAACGEDMLSRSLLNAGDNRLAPGHRPDEANSIPVKVSSLDKIVAGRRVDFVKIDVQGWELEAFRGMEETFAANAQIKLLFEFWPYGLLKAGCEPVAVLRDLGQRGFSIYACQTRGARPIEDADGFVKGLSGRRYTNLYAERADSSRPANSRRLSDE
jgi:FkbM family methyltransferase